MNSLATPSIPAYAHPVHRGIDGLRGRRIEGPRTKASTERRSAYAAHYAAATTKPAPSHTPAQFLAVAR